MKIIIPTPHLGEWTSVMTHRVSSSSSSSSSSVHREEVLSTPDWKLRPHSSSS